MADDNSHGHAEEQEPPEEEETAPLGNHFYDIINKNISGEGHTHELPQLRPDDVAEHLGERQIVVKVIAGTPCDQQKLDDDQVSLDLGTGDDVVPQSQPSTLVEKLGTGLEDVSEEESTAVDKDPTPPISQPGPTQSARLKKRRQSQKAAFREPDYGKKRRTSSQARPQPTRGLTREEVDQLYDSVPSDNEKQSEHSEDQGDAEEQAGEDERSGTPENKDLVDFGIKTGGDEHPEESEVEEMEDGESDENNNNDQQSDHEVDETVMIEDSILIGPPNEHEEPVTATMRGKPIQSLIAAMASKSFTRSKNWERDFRLGMEEDKEACMRRHKDDITPMLSQHLFDKLYDLWRLCHKTPRAPEFKAQLSYVREKQSMFDKLIKTISQRVSEICSRLRQQPTLPASEKVLKLRWGRSAVATLFNILIPMVVLVIKEAFLIGCNVPMEHSDLAVSTLDGEFTSYSLQLLMRSTVWARGLHAAMNARLALRSPKPRDASLEYTQRLQKTQHNREHVGDLLSLLRAALDSATDQIEHLVSKKERHRQAKKRDEEARRLREAREQKHRDEQDEQMQRFVQSTQRASVPVRQPKPKLDYFQKHGWYFWEDDRLLSTIRCVVNPDIEVLARMVPSRSIIEVTERAKELKDRMRRKYNAMGLEPPQWCYDYL